jgi:hypothetical protein
MKIAVELKAMSRFASVANTRNSGRSIRRNGLPLDVCVNAAGSTRVSLVAGNWGYLRRKEFDN